MASVVTFLSQSWRQTSAILLMVIATVGAPSSARNVDFTSDNALLLQAQTAIIQNPLVGFQPVIQNNSLRSNPDVGVGAVTYLGAQSVIIQRKVDFVNYFIKSDLSLGVRYNYNFDFDVGAENKKGAAAAVPDGWYRLDLVVVLPEAATPKYLTRVGANLKATVYDRYVTSKSLIVMVSQQRVNRNITLDFPEITATTLVDHLYVSFTRIRSICGSIRYKTYDCLPMTSLGNADLQKSEVHPFPNIQPYLLDVPFVPYASSGSGRGSASSSAFSPDPNKALTAAQYIAISELYQKKKRDQLPKALSAEEYAEQNRLHFIATNDPILDQAADWSLRNGQIDSMLSEILNSPDGGTLNVDEKYRPLFADLCAVLAQASASQHKKSASLWSSFMSSGDGDLKSVVSKCGQQPQNYLRMARVTHVNAFEKDANAYDAHLLKLSVQENFMVSRTKSKDSWWGVSPLVPVFRLLDAFGTMIFPAAGIAIDVVGSTILHTAGVDDSRAASGGESTSTSTSLDFNKVTLDIAVSQYQRCLEVLPIPEQNNPFFDNATDATTKNGLYICQSVSNQKTIMPEAYGHAFVHTGETSLADSYSPLAQTVNASMQGDRDMSAFYFTLRQSMSPNDKTNPEVFDMTEAATRYFAATPPGSRNVIINPVAFPQETAPTLVGRILGTVDEKFPTAVH